MPQGGVQKFCRRLNPFRFGCVRMETKIFFPRKEPEAHIASLLTPHATHYSYWSTQTKKKRKKRSKKEESDRPSCFGPSVAKQRPGLCHAARHYQHDGWILLTGYCPCTGTHTRISLGHSVRLPRRGIIRAKPGPVDTSKLALSRSGLH